MMPALFGLDMLTVFGLAIVGCGALGWLLGPAVGGALFRAMNRSSMPGMTQVRFPQNRTLLFYFPFHFVIFLIQFYRYRERSNSSSI